MGVHVFYAGLEKVSTSRLAKEIRKKIPQDTPRYKAYVSSLRARMRADPARPPVSRQMSAELSRVSEARRSSSDIQMHNPFLGSTKLIQGRIPAAFDDASKDYVEAGKVEKSVRSEMKRYSSWLKNRIKDYPKGHKRNETFEYKPYIAKAKKPAWEEGF